MDTVRGAVPWRTQETELVQLLARAIQQFHTYPSSSPLCRNAVDAAIAALGDPALREQVTFRVQPRELVLDDVPVGAGTIVETELARRLHGAAVAQVTIEKQTSARELGRFCLDLLACDARGATRLNLVDLLEEHGVKRIALRAAHRPQVLAIAAPAAPLGDLIQHQRAKREERFAADGGAVGHLYPPDKGWVRVDPAATLDQVSVVDLALLCQDPHALAGMLLRLTEEDVAEVGELGDALSRKFSDVARLFEALDPQLSRIMFGKLARAVLDLEPDVRQTLLRRTILPGLLDGKVDGSVLKDFPDLELAESLCLLMDLETAAPEVVTSALARLDLSAERHAAVLPLVRARLEEQGHSKAVESGLDAHARRLIRVDRDGERSFADFAAFDLSLDPATLETLDGIRDAIVDTDVAITQLECLWRLARLEPNPEVVQRFMMRSLRLIEGLEVEDRWDEVAAWLAGYRGLAAACAEQRPDVDEAITACLIDFSGPDRAASLVALCQRGDAGRATAGAILEALGAAIVPSLLAAIRSGQGTERDGGARAAMQLLSEHARLVAPTLAATIAADDRSAHRTAARVLGLAGAGFEPPLGQLLGSEDEQTVRDALRSLARIGSARAAAIVGTALQQRRDWVRGAAEQTLWHFPRVEAERQILQLLARREFVLRHPDAAGRLIERLLPSRPAGLEPVLRPLVPLRYRFWNPALVRVARQARTLLAS